MNSIYYYYFYMLLALICCFVLIRHADNRYFVGLCTIWLFFAPILNNPNFTITIPYFGFNLVSSRLLFFGMLPLVAIYLIYRIRVPFERFQRLDLLLAFYFVTLVGVQFINFQKIGLNTFLINVVAALTFLFIYYLAKQYISEKDFKVLKQALLLFVILSAIVGIIQFTIDPLFLKYGTTRQAFGDLVRANGLTDSETTQGSMMIIALLIAIDLYKNRLFKFGFFCLFAVAAFFTMLRLAWGVFIIITVGILIYQLRRHIRILILSSAFICLIGIAIFVNFENGINFAIRNSGFGSRLIQDSLSARATYYVHVPDIALANPLGIADYSNSVYSRWVINSGIFVGNGPILVIHDGFLATVVKFGAIGLISFLAFYGFVIGYSLNLYKTNPKTGLFLLLLCVTYLGFNATNDFSFSAGQNLPIILNLFLGSVISIGTKQIRRL